MPGDRLGYSVALFADGDVLVSGGHSGASWTTQPDVTAPDTLSSGVAFSGDGHTLIAGAPNVAPCTQSVGCGGTIYVFAHRGSGWTQSAALVHTGPVPGDDLGSVVAISGDGATIAGGALAGLVLFTFDGTSWTEQPTLALDDAGVIGSLALSSDDTRVLAGIPRDNSCNMDPRGAGCTQAGATYLYARPHDRWPRVPQGTERRPAGSVRDQRRDVVGRHHARARRVRLFDEDCVGTLRA